MKGKHTVLVPLFIAIISVILFYSVGCKKSESSTPDPVGVYTGYSGCNSLQDATFDDRPVKECIGYQYNGSGTLSLGHYNALFNCCPGEVQAIIEIKGNTIFITESQLEAACRCNCHYDLDFQISGIQSGQYTIQITCEDGRSLSYSITLTSGESSGNRCWDSPLANFTSPDQ